MTSAPRSLRSPHVTGILAGLVAFLWWGCFPLYWDLLKGVPAFEILAHRIFWSLFFAVIVLAVDRQLVAFAAILTDRRLLLRSFISALIIAANWGMYIWAVTNGYVLHASLGYFFNPLFNVLLGVLLLGEKLSSLQKVALSLAALGCFWMVAWVGEIPWVGLLIAGSFAIYGFMRKTSAIGALDGFALETLILSPFALGYLWWIHANGEMVFLRQDFLTDMLLVGAGSVTAVPLILFAQAARQIPLSMVGLLQYISPTCQFLLAIFYFHEPFSLGHFVAFAFIWSGLAFFSYDLWRGRRRKSDQVSELFGRNASGDSSSSGG